jgi:hypothetical protein
MVIQSHLHESLAMLEKYLAEADAVEGWLHPFSGRFIANLSILQQGHRLRGSLGEIGVHMGRLFIILKLMRVGDEKCFAIDLFQHQHLNPGRSGWGDRATFIRNVTNWAGNAEDIVIFEKSSLEVRSSEILRACGRSRLLSIDGGHTAECVYNDLRLAETIMHNYGVVILDDFFNPHWPGVVTGAARYFQRWRSRLIPFAITPNKLYLTSIRYHEFYLNQMGEECASLLEQTKEMFGSRVNVFGCAAGVQALIE